MTEGWGGNDQNLETDETSKPRFVDPKMVMGPPPKPNDAGIVNGNIGLQQMAKTEEAKNMAMKRAHDSIKTPLAQNNLLLQEAYEPQNRRDDRVRSGSRTQKKVAKSRRNGSQDVNRVTQEDAGIGVLGSMDKASSNTRSATEQQQYVGVQNTSSKHYSAAKRKRQESGSL